MLSKFKPYLQAVKAGVKENLQFRGELIGPIAGALLKVVFLSAIWGSLYPSKDWMVPYYLAITLVVPETMIIDMVSRYVEKIKQGGTLEFSKPIYPPFLIFASAFGMNLVSIMLSALVGFLALAVFYGIGSFEAVIGFLLLLGGALVFDMGVAYLITSISYWTYSVWGLRVLFRLLLLILGGVLVPLSLFSSDFLELVSHTPFPYRFYYGAMGILGGDVSLFLKAFVGMLFWGVLFLIVAAPIHIRGFKKFESQGG